MSVRSSILALLTLGPAYGLQVHSEIEARTSRLGRINVGQIYATLTRLVEAGLVEPVSADLDGSVPPGTAVARLPFYELTTAGRLEAGTWLAGAPEGEPAWEEMVEHILLACTLPGADPLRLLGSYRTVWSRSPECTPSEPHDLAESARRQLTEAALRWLGEVEQRWMSGTLLTRALSSDRPRRGRRPVARS
ncbi:PadR family transcriptional regulator [Subtercola boreus]|uniref:Transcription regulator PadR N-terminal domain-containing protein n=1 Tax=Subtercola boreus TaxID=120213 RepID=A0A3E0WAA8_9MICO|nr:PadR family transcriptional regulator [Subtercola boreus]RFA20798.1 hypothetical protein B7R24_08500 [Subtercola boreus]RFA20913.1 hypothetical protein B7R23_08440 [Subtercola boreus]RFA27106.1 hypothetical protein B7R25_08565 [Subtercola boreus]